MAVKNKITSNPLMAIDVVDTLAHNGGIGVTSGNLLSCFTLISGLNPWSKSKPMRHTAPIEMTNEQKRELGRAATGASNGEKVGGWGIRVYHAFKTSPIDFYLNTMKSKKAGYMYLRPSGSQHSPYRMSDFIGYFPAAPMPTTNTFDDDQVIFDTTTTITLMGGVQGETLNSDDCVTIDDLYPQIDNGDGTTSPPNKGILVVYKNSQNLDAYLWATTQLPYNGVIAGWRSILEGKKATIMEFFTNYPANRNSNLSSIKDPNPSWDNTEYWIASTPDPIKSVQFQDSDGTIVPPGSGSDGLLPAAVKIAENGQPKFASLKGNAQDYSQVIARFYFSSKGNSYKGGNITDIRYGLYSDSALTQEIDVRTATSFNLPNNSDSSIFGTGIRFNNSTGRANIYFGVRYGGYKRYASIPLVEMDITPAT